jgi:hypothetical protein
MGKYTVNVFSAVRGVEEATCFCDEGNEKRMKKFA